MVKHLSRRIVSNPWQFLFQSVVMILLILGALLALMPFAYMISTSFKTPIEVFDLPIRWVPERISWTNYKQVFTEVPFMRYTANSLFVGIAVVLANVLTCSAAGYSFSKFAYRGQNTMFGLVLGTLMVPLSVIYVPLFILVYNFGWVDTYQGLIIPGATSAFGIFLMRQNIQAIPDGLVEAARLDGASEIRIFLTIVIPLARQAIAALSILVFLTSWDSLLWPLLIANQESLHTIPLGLSRLTSNYGTNYPVLMAASTMALLPVLLVFFALQRHFVNAWMFSGTKE